jgi:hypothetical protein
MHITGMPTFTDPNITIPPPPKFGKGKHRRGEPIMVWTASLRSIQDLDPLFQALAMPTH